MAKSGAYRLEKIWLVTFDPSVGTEIKELTKIKQSG